MCPIEFYKLPKLFRSRWGAVLLLFVTCFLLGCAQDMADQPKATPLSPSPFYPQTGSARPLVEGTVARGSTAQDYLDVSPDTDTFPVPVTEELLARGRERFDIYCTPCHGYTGDGDGMVVRRGFPRPPSYHSEQLRNMPVGQFYNVISHGFGRMPEYGTQVPPMDRWAIVAYIRALQLSQHAPLAELPVEDRARVQAAASAQTVPTAGPANSGAEK